MASTTSKSTRISAMVLSGLFVLTLGAAFVVPFVQKDEIADQSSQIEQSLEELKNQQAEVEETPAEVDETLKVAGDITTMRIEDITTGTGQEAKLGDTIKVKYKGVLAADGTVFDSNSDGVEFPLEVGGLIEGWTEGVPGMKVGGKRKLTIPSEKGYGAQGSGTIPANADLVFEIELISIS